MSNDTDSGAPGAGESQQDAEAPTKYQLHGALHTTRKDAKGKPVATVIEGQGKRSLVAASDLTAEEIALGRAQGILTPWEE